MPPHLSTALRVSVPRIIILCLLTLSAIVVAQGASAQQTNGIPITDPGKAQLFASPGSIRPTQGKYPASVPLILWINGCLPGQSKDPTKTFAPDSTFSIVVFGAGLYTSGTPGISDCGLSTTLNIVPGVASAGNFMVTVTEVPKGGDTTKSESRGYALISLIDPAAGNIPANQQVDVIWGVLSKHLCKDNFGGHLSNDVYCIEVKIGNNTGYAIQLAGVGFKPSANPDFKISDTVNFPALETPNVAYQSVRSSAQGYAFSTYRNLLVNGAGGIGILMASFNPFFRSSFNLARWAAGTTVVGTALPNGVNAVMPDLTLKQLNNLDDQAFRDNLVIPNNTQIRTMVFVETKLLDGIGRTPYQYWCNQIYTKDTPEARKCAKTKDDPLAVKMALGQIEIIGDEISFIQRVVVDPAALSQAGNLNPVVTGQSATSNTVTLTFQGNAPANATATIVSNSPLDSNFSTPATLTSTTSTNPSQLVFALPTTPTGLQLTDGDVYTIAINVPNVAPFTELVQVPITVTLVTGATASKTVTVTFQGNAPVTSNSAIMGAQIVPATGTAMSLTGPSVPAGNPNELQFNVTSLPAGPYTLTIPNVPIAASAAAFKAH